MIEWGSSEKVFLINSPFGNIKTGSWALGWEYTEGFSLDKLESPTPTNEEAPPSPPADVTMGDAGLMRDPDHISSWRDLKKKPKFLISSFKLWKADSI